MLEFLRKLFATDFMPHVYCLRLPEVIWLHVVSDGLIAASYFLIPAALVLLIRRRPDLAFSWMFALFGVFILACGSTHLLAIYTLWHPIYRFDGALKAVTALASMPTALLLFRLLPKAVALPSPAQLQNEVQQRRSAENNVRRLNAELEDRVKERTAALAASEARFRAAVKCVSDIIWTNNAEGRMFGDQPGWAAFTGQTMDQYCEFGWSKAIHPADAQPTLAAWETAVTQRQMFVFKHRVRRHDGVYRLFSVRAVPVTDDTSGTSEWVGVHADITEAHEIQEDLRTAKLAAESASRAKSAFLANISHELRTPLNAIIGYCEILEEEAQERGTVSMLSDLRRIHTSGKHLLDLVSDVLDLSKIETGRMELSFGEFAVSNVAREAGDTARDWFTKQANQFNLRVEPGAGEMKSDAALLRKCLLNLLSNAAKFTHEGRAVLEVCADGQHHVIFRVSDTGIGMSPSQTEHIFEPFTQVDSSYARRFSGTGLGLALTHYMVRLLGGEISVSSELGAGSVFTMRFPRTLSILRG